MFSTIASMAVHLGAKAILGGGKKGSARRPTFSKRQAPVVTSVRETGTRQPRFEEFADLGTAGQVGALISRHDKLMSSIIDLDDKDLKV